MGRFFKAIRSIALKDLRTELRNRQLIGAMGLFGLLTAMVFYYGLQGRRDVQVAVLPAVLWVTVIFAGTQGIGRSLGQEHDRGTLDGLLLAPIERAALFYGKLISGWLFALVVATVISLALNFLFNTNLLRLDWWVVILLGSLGFAAIGTLLGSMAVHARGRETTLPIIILPISLPIIIAGVNACSSILENDPLPEWGVYLVALFAYDVIFLTLALVVFDFIVEE